MIYTFPFYIVTIPIAVALLSGTIGVYLARKRFPSRVSIVALAICVLSAGIFAPSIAIDKVELNEESLYQSTGFWFSRTVKGFDYSEVSSIAVTTAKDRKGRDYELWVLSYQDGQTLSIDPGDLWVMHSEEITGFLRAKGLQIARVPSM